MCIAIVTPGDQEPITPEQFNQSMNSNPDGIGLGYVKDGEFRIAKTLVRGAFLYDEYVRAVTNGRNTILHFRKATHGVVSVENCHPFFNGEDEIFIHNGIMKYAEDMPDGAVDSELFGPRILSLLKEGWREEKEAIALLEDWLGWSKVALMDRKGDVIILNESKGNWDNGSWFSNSSYKKYDKKYGKNWYSYDPTYGSSKKGEQKLLTRDLSTGEWRKNSSGEEDETFDPEKTYRDKDSGSNHIVLYSSLDREFVPHGFEVMDWNVCSYCCSVGTIEAYGALPVFLNPSDSFECAGCKTTVKEDSPLNFVAYFNRDTLEEEDMRIVRQTIEYYREKMGT